MHRAKSTKRSREPESGSKAGRPRSVAADQAILTATIAQIREVGYDSVTMEGIASVAGVAKATLYRRWDGKEVLVAYALNEFAKAIAIPDTGTLRGDVLAVMRGAGAMYRDPATGALLSGLVAVIARSKPIAAAFRGGFVAARRTALRVVLERWRDRGDLRPDVNVEILMDMIAGPLFYRFLLRGETVSDSVIEVVLDTLLLGIQTREPRHTMQGGRE